MRLVPILTIATAVMLLSPSAANAAPVAAAISAIGTFFAGNAIAGQLLKLGLALALSAWQRSRIDRPDRPGIRIEQTLEGDTNPDTFIVGRYATAGALAGPPMSHGSRNQYFTEVIDLGGVPGMVLESIYLSDEARPLRFDQPHPDYGTPIQQEGDPESNGMLTSPTMWVKFYDGTQTVADAMLLDRYGDDPDFPWTADMIGRGRCYAIITTLYQQERQSQLPQKKFGLRGIPLYDPRLDGSRDGLGAHRWEDRSTWEPSENTAVQIYNLLRGIPIGDEIYGGLVDPSDLPSDVFFVAMNECDRQVDDGDGLVAQYRSGTEVDVSEAPSDVIERLMRTCSGAISEAGGAFTLRIGAPGQPVHYITDGDIVVSEPQSLDPHPSLDQTINGLSFTYLDPATAWKAREGTRVIRAELEILDDGRRLLRNMQYDALAYGPQAQRVSTAYVNDSRRFLSHVNPLPPDAAHLKPLDVYSWTSARNGYASKRFEITESETDLHTYITTTTVREVDYDDWVFSPGDIVLAPVLDPTRTAPDMGAPDFSVSGFVLNDSQGNARRPALAIVPDDPLATYDVESLLASETIAGPRLSAVRPLEGVIVLENGILPGELYGVRIRYTPDGLDTPWSVAKAVQAPDARLTAEDFGDVLQAQFDAAAQAASDAAAVVDDVNAVQAGLTALADDLINNYLTASEVGVVVAGETDTIRVELQSIDTTLSAQIDAVEALQVGAGTAFATLLTALQVQTDGSSAAVEQFAAAEARLDGFAAAYTGLAVTTNGGQVAEIRLTSFDDPDGASGSAIQLNAQTTIAEGTIATNKLVVGLGKNLLKNADFAQRLRFWDGPLGPVGQRTESAMIFNPPGEPYAGASFPTLRLRQIGSTNDGFVNVQTVETTAAGQTSTDAVPVAPGTWFYASVRAAMIGCSGRMQLRFNDLAGAVLGQVQVAIPDLSASAENPETWPVYAIKGQAPAGAASAQVFLEKSGPTGGATASDAYFYHPMLEETHAAATSPSPWSPPGTTLIDGGNAIFDGSLTAETLNVGSMQTAGLAIFGGALQSTGYDAGVSGWMIDAIGNAEFNDLIIRTPQIEPGAVTVTRAANQVGTISTLPRAAPVVATEVTIPSTGMEIEIAALFEWRNVQQFLIEQYPALMKLQRRLGSGSWTTLRTSTLNDRMQTRTPNSSTYTDPSAWRQVPMAFLDTPATGSVGYRLLIANDTFPSNANDQGYTIEIRNAFLKATELKR